jgi:hypothetical protein
MATKLYTIENLLVGQNYRSRNRNFEGVVTHAENTEAYVIQVRPTYGLSDRYATVAVKVGE